MKSVLLLGVPASGKSTLANEILKIEQDLGVFRASEILRNSAKSTWFEYWARGENAPDAEVAEVLWDSYGRMSSVSSKLLLDGYPRSAAQYRDFRERGGVLAGVLELVADPSTLRRRNVERVMERPAEQREVDYDSRAAREAVAIESLKRALPSQVRVLQLSTENLDARSAAVRAIEFMRSIVG